MTLKAVLFDLDGTLVDTLPDLSAAIAALMLEQGLEPPSAETVRKMIGDGARVLVERALSWGKGGVTEAELALAHARFLEIYNAAPCAASKVYPNVVPALERLRGAGARLGVCTNKPQAPADVILAELGLAPWFEAVVGGDAIARRKPHADHPRQVLTMLDASPDAAILVGDSHNDLASARACGMKCILVDFGYTAIPAAELGADAVISDFAALGQTIERLMAA